jgi:hypothetical protein
MTGVIPFACGNIVAMRALGAVIEKTRLPGRYTRISIAKTLPTDRVSRTDPTIPAGGFEGRGLAREAVWIAVEASLAVGAGRACFSLELELLTEGVIETVQTRLAAVCF